MKLRNEKGYSLTEILVATGILGLVSLGGMTLMRNQTRGEMKFKQSLGQASAMKMIEMRLRGRGGCDALIGKGVDSNLELPLQAVNKESAEAPAPNQTLNPGGAVTPGGKISKSPKAPEHEGKYPETQKKNEQNVGSIKGTSGGAPLTIKSGSKIDGLEIGEFRFHAYHPVSNGGSLGIAEIRISTIAQDGSNSIMTFPMQVSMENGVIIACGSGNRGLSEVADDLCEKVYGSFSEGLSCAEVVAKLQREAINEVCRDLYGAGKSAEFKASACDLSLIHADENCPTGEGVYGFNSAGRIRCRKLNLASSPIPSPDPSSPLLPDPMAPSLPDPSAPKVTGPKTCNPLKMDPITGCMYKVDDVELQTWGLENHCFLPGTQITLSDGSTRAIETIEVGALVRSFDEARGMWVSAPVTKVISHAEKENQIFHFLLDSGKLLSANFIHPLYLKNRGDYLKAGKVFGLIQAGLDVVLLGSRGEDVRVIGTSVSVEVTELHNLHVKSSYDTSSGESDIGHNYIAEGVLVHNKADGGFICKESIACCSSVGAIYDGAGGCSGSYDQHSQYVSCFQAKIPNFNYAPYQGNCQPDKSSF